MSPAASEEVVLFPESLLTAAAYPDPYPYYAALLAYRPFYQEHRLGLWVALGAQEVAETLASEAVRVRPPAEPVPAAIMGAPAGDIFRDLVRMNDGHRHAQAKAAVGACLRAFGPAQAAAIARRDATTLARTLAVQHRQGLDLFNVALPVRVVARLIGLPEDMAGQCAALVAISCAACRRSAVPTRSREATGPPSHCCSFCALNGGEVVTAAWPPMSSDCAISASTPAMRCWPTSSASCRRPTKRPRG